MDGWTGVASLPTHSKMPQEWKFELINPDGEPVSIDVSTEALTHQPIFGPDVDDLANAEERLRVLIRQAQSSST